MKIGTNVVSILTHYRGEDFSQYRKGHPGLIFQMSCGKIMLISDNSWNCRLSPSFMSGPIAKVTSQLSFTVHYDARKEDAWNEIGYKDVGWAKAREIAGPVDGYWKSLRRRPLPLLTKHNFRPGHLAAQGTFIRDNNLPISSDIKELLTPARMVASNYKRVERESWAGLNDGQSITIPSADHLGKGAFLLFDLGREEVGLLHFCLNAPAGTVLDIAHGEHLDDLGVRALVGGREFADRYICREGENTFTFPFRRLGCRYLEFHLLRFGRPVTVRCAGVMPLSYPVRKKGSFSVPDSLMIKIRATAIRTLRLCMHEHYEDCPWREQSLYSGDGRFQALYGYYAFGEYDFPEVSFSLLGWSQRPDNLLGLCAPARENKVTIPAESLNWISALRDFFLFSGRSHLFRQFRPAVERIISSFLTKHDKQTGLYKLFEGGYWTFYEWAPGLDGLPGGEWPPETKEFRLDAPHNLLLLEALEAYREMLIFCGERNAAESLRIKASALRKAIHDNFWDKKRQLYATFMNRKRKWHYCELTQALAVTNTVGSAGTRATLRNVILNSQELIPVSYYRLIYKAMSMIGTGPSEQTRLIEACTDMFASMLFRQATSFWETAKGADDFAYAGSLCHGWSGFPVWLNQAYILGVMPLTPGFKTFSVSPHVANMPCASGNIPTPAGIIAVEWEKSRRLFTLNVRAPISCKPFFKPYVATELKRKVFLNGRSINV